MSFEVNEVPKKVLSAISRTEFARGCAAAWTIICCPFTLAATFWCDCSDDVIGCCFPKPLPPITDASLEHLKNILKTRVMVKLKPEQENNENYKYQVVEAQVKYTLEYLKEFLDKDSKQLKIEGAYRMAIQEVYEEILLKAEAEARAKRVEEKVREKTEASPLLNQNSLPLHDFGIDATSLRN